MKRSLFIIISLLIACCGYTQQAPAPQWISKPPKAGNDTYLYVRERGEGYSRQDALNRALTEVFRTTALRVGQPFDGQKVNESLQHGTPLEVISRQYNIPINKVCEYSKTLPNGQVQLYVLCQVAKYGNIVPQWDEYSQCNKSPDGGNITALIKSMFIPGLGQMGKGYVTEGVLTLVGEVALIGGAVGCYYIAQDKLNVMRNPMVSYEKFISARQTYNTCQTTSYILWGTAGALYLFNIIRAVSTKERFRDGYSFVPIFMPSELGPTPGVSFTLNF